MANSTASQVMEEKAQLGRVRENIIAFAEFRIGSPPDSESLKVLKNASNMLQLMLIASQVLRATTWRELVHPNTSTKKSTRKKKS